MAQNESEQVEAKTKTPDEGEKTRKAKKKKPKRHRYEWVEIIAQSITLVTWGISFIYFVAWMRSPTDPAWKYPGLPVAGFVAATLLAVIVMFGREPETPKLPIKHDLAPAERLSNLLRIRASTHRTFAMVTLVLVLGSIFAGLAVFAYAGFFSVSSFNNAVLARKYNEQKSRQVATGFASLEFFLGDIKANTRNWNEFFFVRPGEHPDRACDPNTTIDLQKVTRDIQVFEADPGVSISSMTFPELKKLTLDDQTELLAENNDLRERIIKLEKENSEKQFVDKNALSLRIAIALLLSYLVRILLNVYRHNLSMSAFYDSRADALLMAGPVEFERLIGVLHPKDLELDPPASPEVMIQGIASKVGGLFGKKKPKDINPSED